MATGSRKQKNRSKKAKFGPEIEPDVEPVLDVRQLAPHLDGASVSVSLRYFKRECECFSVWTKPELKKFSGTVEKLRGHSANKLKRLKPLCDMHKGAPSEGRFSLPEDVSPDISLFEVKVDPSNKLRMHGFFIGQVFFLIWLDREHACFKV